MRRGGLAWISSFSGGEASLNSAAWIWALSWATPSTWSSVGFGVPRRAGRDRRLNVRIERGDLAQLLLAYDSCSDGAAIGMREDKDDLYRLKHRGTVFEAGEDLGRRDVAGNPRHKEVPDALIEDELHRHARIGAGEDRRERHLLRRRLFAAQGEIDVVTRSTCSRHSVGCRP